MYKWHAQSIGRGRPVANDMARVSDAIAASLRHFSVTAGRCADNGGLPAPSTPTPSRAERSKDAFQKVASLVPKPSRGIDARSLASKPPGGGFTIRRQMVGPTEGSPVRSQYGNRPTQFSPGSFGQQNRPGGRDQGSRGGASFKTPQRGGLTGVRGDNPMGRGGGMRGGRGGRGGARGGKMKRDRPKKEIEDDMSEEPYTEAERIGLKLVECGYPGPYQPTTTVENLNLLGTPTVSSPQGINATIQYKLNIASGNALGDYKHASYHLADLHMGSGLTFFEDPEQKKITQEFRGTPQEKMQTGPLSKKFGNRPIGGLNEKTKTALSKAWVAGQHEKPPSPKEEADVLGQVTNSLRRNETYLPGDRRQLEKTIANLLPGLKGSAHKAHTGKPV